VKSPSNIGRDGGECRKRPMLDRFLIKGTVMWYSIVFALQILDVRCHKLMEVACASVRQVMLWLTSVPVVIYLFKHIGLVGSVPRNVW
jgi:hypothetical protein